MEIEILEKTKQPKKQSTKLKSSLVDIINKKDIVMLSYIEDTDIAEVFKKAFIISNCPGKRIRCKEAINLLRNDLVTVSAIKNFLSKHFKVVNIHGVLFYKDLSIEKKTNTLDQEI